MAVSTATESQALAESVCKETIALVQRTTFSISTGRDKTRLALLLCGVEYADFVLASLSRISVNMSIMPVFRAAFEAWRDLRVLTEDESHLFRMKRDFFSSKRQVLRAQIKYAQSDPTTTHRIKDLNIELDEVKAQLNKPELAGLKDEDVLAKALNDDGTLAMLWPLLCDLSHNNLNALAERHFPDHGSRERKLSIFSPLDAKLRSIILTKQIMFLVTGLESLRSLVKDNCVADFDKTLGMMNAMWLKAMEIEIEALAIPKDIVTKSKST